MKKLKMLRSVLSVLIVMALAAGMLPVGLSAEDRSSWDGSSVSQPSTTEIDGQTYYQISSAAELAWFAGLVNGTLNGVSRNTGANAVLTADIDLNNQKWTPMGSDSNPYTGIFEGNGKKILNLVIESTRTYCAFFSFNSGTVKNLTIESGSISASHNGCTSLVGFNNGRVANCLNRADVYSSGTFTAGLVGRNYGFILNSVNLGNVIYSGTSTEANVGGITSDNRNNGVIISCYNGGSVTSTENKNNIGGIAGYNNGSTLINSYNYGNVSSTGSNVGGLCGYASGSFENNYFLKTAEINSSLNPFGSGTVTDEKAKAWNAVELAAGAAILGDDFTLDSTDPQINNGYPVLVWQSSGQYVDPWQAELDGLCVTAVSVEKGTVSVTLDRVLRITTLSAADFTATIAVDDGQPQTLAITGINQSADTVDLTFSKITAGTDDHIISVSVSYADGVSQSGSVSIETSPYWLPFAQRRLRATVRKNHSSNWAMPKSWPGLADGQPEHCGNGTNTAANAF
jgi:hypothetical protein